MFINDYVAVLDSVRLTSRIPGAPDLEGGIGVMAFLRFLGTDKEFDARPSYILTKDRISLNRPEIVEDLGVRIAMDYIDPEKGKFHFTTNTTQLGYVILKVVKKPLINILWIGTVVLIIGFLISIYRRFAA